MSANADPRLEEIADALGVAADEVGLATRALDELASQEEGMRFQGLAVVIGKKRWPELIARQRKKDLGLDAYAPSSLTPERIGKGLAALSRQGE